MVAVRFELDSLAVTANVMVLSFCETVSQFAEEDTDQEQFAVTVTVLEFGVPEKSISDFDNDIMGVAPAWVTEIGVSYFQSLTLDLR